MRGSILIVALFLLHSCNQEQKAKQQEVQKVQHHEEKVLSIDSTLYYDSVNKDLAQKIDNYFKIRAKNKTFNGTILFAKNKHLVIKKAYGGATFKRNKIKDTLTVEHTFQLASASKPFTAVAVMMLAEQNKINLQDSVQQYIPNFPYQGITIEQLLSHRSGLSQYAYFCDQPDSIWPNKDKAIHNKDVINIMEQYVPMQNYPPNKKFYYSNTNYMLLASIVEKVSGVPFENFLRQNIFTPLKMTNTVVYNRENKQELINPAIGYNGNYVPEIDIYLNGVVGDKGVYSNVDDMYKFYLGLVENKLVSPKTFQQMITPKHKKRKDGKNYGYGFRLLEKENGKIIVFHTGWWYGFRTYFIMSPDLQNVSIVLTNLKRGKFLSVRELEELLEG